MNLANIFNHGSLADRTYHKLYLVIKKCLPQKYGYKFFLRANPDRMRARFRRYVSRTVSARICKLKGHDWYASHTWTSEKYCCSYCTSTVVGSKDKIVLLPVRYR